MSVCWLVLCRDDRGHRSDASGAFGVGFAVVKFDTKMKFTDKDSGNSIFVDPEGDHSLPEVSHVNYVYGAYRFGKKHTVGFAYSGINREATLFEGEIDLDDVVVANGSVKLTDSTDFYFLNYGYTLFADERSEILGILGIYALDLNYGLQAQGELTIGGDTTADSVREEVSIIAPLPLVGFNFLFNFTPRWGMRTKVVLVGGSYQGVSAGVLQSTISAHYTFNRRLQGVIGLAYFDADVTIDRASSRDEIAWTST